jgi:hypothetical protein
MTYVKGQNDMNDIIEKLYVVELKYKCIKLLYNLEEDEVYSKKHAAKELRTMITLLEHMDTDRKWIYSES